MAQAKSPRQPSQIQGRGEPNETIPNTPDGEGSGRYSNGEGNRRKHHVNRQAVRYPSGDSVGAHEAVTSASHEQLLSANHSQSGSSAMPLSVLLRRLSLRVASRLELEWR